MQRWTRRSNCRDADGPCSKGALGTMCPPTPRAAWRLFGGRSRGDAAPPYGEPHAYGAMSWRTRRVSVPMPTRRTWSAGLPSARHKALRDRGRKSQERSSRPASPPHPLAGCWTPILRASCAAPASHRLRRHALFLHLHRLYARGLCCH